MLAVSPEVLIIPQFLIVRALGLYDTFAAIVLPYLATPFSVFLMRQFFLKIPVEIEEAARVDGATPTQVFRHIVLPQLAGVIALIAVLRFIFTFNAFDEIYLLTGGGAGTQVLATQVYSFLTARADVGASAAVAMFMAAVLAVLLMVYLRFFGERERLS
jgi:multiple sugar transport system permease protein